MGPNEPIKNNLYPAGLVVALATLFTSLSVAQDITLQVAFGAIGASLAQFGAIAFATKRARDQAWGPDSVSEIMDADTVIRQAEQDG